MADDTTETPAPTDAPEPTPAAATTNDLAGVPWWARPGYIKKLGAVLVVVLTAVLAALWQFGVLGGGEDPVKESPEEAGAVAPEVPGATPEAPAEKPAEKPTEGSTQTPAKDQAPADPPADDDKK